jgi:hypothetical protein
MALRANWKEHLRLVRNATLTGALACALGVADVRPSAAHTHGAPAKHSGSEPSRHQTVGDAGRSDRHGGRHVDAVSPSNDRTGGSGMASVYSGGRTASGEHMNSGDMTAAHRTLPFGTRVTVVNYHTPPSRRFRRCHSRSGVVLKVQTVCRISFADLAMRTT